MWFLIRLRYIRLFRNSWVEPEDRQPCHGPVFLSLVQHMDFQQSIVNAVFTSATAWHLSSSQTLLSSSITQRGPDESENWYNSSLAAQVIAVQRRNIRSPEISDALPQSVEKVEQAKRQHHASQNVQTRGVLANDCFSCHSWGSMKRICS